jgi:hypothetical protein
MFKSELLNENTGYGIYMIFVFPILLCIFILFIQRTFKFHIDTVIAFLIILFALFVLIFKRC